jgi:3-hydroxymyristoyl/3-hydroxydecanoyl-(acyl carrier protein) dehydratase
MEWHSLELTRHHKEEITAIAEVPPDSPWFSGHFPDDPILPGVALLSMTANAVIRSHPRAGHVIGVKKVRFKRVVKPNDCLIIKAKPDEKKSLSYVFEITCRGEVACTGTLLMGSSSGFETNAKKPND